MDAYTSNRTLKLVHKPNIISTQMSLVVHTLCWHRATKEMKPIDAISYKLMLYMPLCLIVRMILLSLLLLHCILSQTIATFPTAIVNIISVRSLFFFHSHTRLQQQRAVLTRVVTYILSQDCGTSNMLLAVTNSKMSCLQYSIDYRKYIILTLTLLSVCSIESRVQCLAVHKMYVIFLPVPCIIGRFGL